MEWCDQTSALKILFSLLKHLSQSLSKSSAHPQFHVPYFKKIVAAVLLAPPFGEVKHGQRAVVRKHDGRLDAEVRDLFLGTWLNVYDDVRWFFLRDAEYVLYLASLIHAHAEAIRHLERLYHPSQ